MRPKIIHCHADGGKANSVVRREGVGFLGLPRKQVGVKSGELKFLVGPGFFINEIDERRNYKPR